MPRQKFAMVLAELWDDPAVRELGTDARLLFLWSFTCPQSNVAGLYQASITDLVGALGTEASEGRIDGALAQLAAKPLLGYDWDHELVWVVNRARHSGHAPKLHRLIRADYQAAPPSPLRTAFADKYGAMFDLPTIGDQ